MYFLFFTRFFDGSKSYLDPIFNDPDFNNIENVLNAANNNEETKREVQQFLGKDGEISDDRVYTSITKVTIFIGLPLFGYDNTTDRESEQTTKLQNFAKNDLNVIASKHHKNGAGKMNFYYSSLHILNSIIFSQMIRDLMLAVGSLFFIFVFMCIQTQSFWVTGFALFSIVSGFTVTLLIYRFILDYRYLGLFHILAVFIILGIGADDIFVFFDTWKQDGRQKFKSTAHRYCIRKTVS